MMKRQIAKGSQQHIALPDRYMFMGFGMIMLQIPRFSVNFLTFAPMQNPLLSLHSILEALGLDSACIPLLEQTQGYEDLIQANSPVSVYAAIRTIGNTLNTKPQADQLAEDLEERINIITHKLKFIADAHKPKVLCLDAVSPMVVAYNPYIDNLVRVAGGINYFDADLDVLNPDILIINSDTAIPQLLSELPNALATREWTQTNAVRNDNIYVIHDGYHLRQPGANIADDAEILAEIINPQYFIFGRNEDVWMKFSLS